MRFFVFKPFSSAFQALCKHRNEMASVRRPPPPFPRYRQTEAMPTTIDGKCIIRPRCDILVCGIVCKDISGLSRTPKAINGVGKSGQALQGLLAALGAMASEERPRLVSLECVSRLGSRRHVDEDERPGTEFVSAELHKLGYVGKWYKLKPCNFFLPQSRARVYSIHLKVADFSEKSLARRKEDLADASKILSRLQTTEAEDLRVLLRKLPPVITEPAASSGVACARKGGKWQASHADFVKTHGFSPQECQPPCDFAKAVGPLTSVRGLEAMWLKIALWQRKTGKDWREDLLVLPHGHSVTFATVQSNIFPCVTPTHDHIVLEDGRAHKAGGYTALALQGIQSKEVRRWSLAKVQDMFMRDLAGNAFTANIIAAVLIAGMLVM